MDAHSPKRCGADGVAAGVGVEQDKRHGVYVVEGVSGNRFSIAGGTPGLEVSWQVTGIRQDAFANANRVPVEVDKAEAARGTYLHPAAFGQPNERGEAAAASARPGPGDGRATVHGLKGGSLPAVPPATRR